MLRLRRRYHRSATASIARAATAHTTPTTIATGKWEVDAPAEFPLPVIVWFEFESDWELGVTETGMKDVTTLGPDAPVGPLLDVRLPLLDLESAADELCARELEPGSLGADGADGTDGVGFDVELGLVTLAGGGSG